MGESRQIPDGIAEREYIKKYAGDDFYRKHRRIGIFGYVMYVVLFVLSLWLPGTPLERLIFLGLTLGIHLGKSKVCAYVLLGFGILETIMLLIVQPRGCATGIVELVVSVTAIQHFSKVHREFISWKTKD